MRKADIKISGGDGPMTSVYLFTPLTKRGATALRKLTNAEPWQFLGTSLAVEHRYALDLSEGLSSRGLRVI